MFSKTQRYFERNYEKSLRATFTQRMTEQLQEQAVAALRIHTSGDFYATDYVEKWLDIVQANKTVRFYAYTRSWAVPGFLSSLAELAAQRNFQLWFSFDRTSPIPPRVRYVRRAYLMLDDTDQPPVRTSLVFRHKRNTFLDATDNRSRVCPHECGRPSALTCSTCGLCWRAPNTKKLASQVLAGSRLL